MIIALDYDNTFTRDPEAWYSAAASLKTFGHTIIGVTMRFERESTDIDPYYFKVCEKVYYTGRHSKRKWCADRNIFPDVWIDDSPEFIVDWTTL